MLATLDRLMNRLSAALAIIGGLGLALAIVATCASALGKLGFRLNKQWFGADAIPDSLQWIKPISGEDELVKFAVGFALYAALPWVMFNRGHVTIDLFEKAFSAPFNRMLNVLGDLTLTVIAWVIFAQQWNLLFKKARRGNEPLLDVVIAGDWAQVAKRFKDSKTTQVMELPEWPLVLWAEFCTLMFFVIGCYCVFRSINQLVHPHAKGASPSV